jgi:hypothetical protein
MVFNANGDSRPGVRHHVAALGELITVENTSIKNVLCNYWTVGIAFVFR